MLRKYTKKYMEKINPRKIKEKTTTKNSKIKQIMLKSYMNWQSEVILDNKELIPQEFTRNRI